MRDRKNSRRVFAILLALVLVFSLTGTTAFYAEAKEPEREPVKRAELTDTMLEMNGSGYDSKTHILTWNVTINPNKVNLKSASFQVLLPKDGILEGEGTEYKLTLAGTEDEIEKKLEDILPEGAALEGVQLEHSEDDRPIGIAFQLNNLGEKSFQFDVAAEIDASFWTVNQSKLDVFNDAELKNSVVVINGKEETLTQKIQVSDSVTVSNQVLEKNHVSYDARNKEMTWELTVNGSKIQGLEGTTIMDTLPRGMTYIENSTTIDGTDRPDAEEFGKTDTSADGVQTVTWKLSGDETEGKTVTLTYKTKIDVNAAPVVGGGIILF